MAIDFKSIEGLDAELLASLESNSAIQSAINDYISTSVENRVAVEKDDFKGKMDNLNAKLQAAESRAVSAKRDDRVSPDKVSPDVAELQASLKNMEEQTAAQKAAYEEQAAKMQQLQVDSVLSQAIDQFNAEYPTVAIKPSLARIVKREALDSVKFDPETGTVKVLDKNGGIMATDSGAATPLDWLKSLRTEVPDLFGRPNGGGAAGSTNVSGGADNKVFSRADYDAMTQEQRAGIGASHKFID